MPTSRNFFSDTDIKKIELAIQSAEKNTSGEIRVHIENHCREDVVQRAVKIFHKLEMNKTELKNGTLFYLAVKDHVFAIIGDEGINKNVSENFWNTLRDVMQEKFKANKFADGLCEGIVKAGEELKKYFPLSDNDRNELSNEITFGKK